VISNKINHMSYSWGVSFRNWRIGKYEPLS